MWFTKKRKTESVDVQHLSNDQLDKLNQLQLENQTLKNEIRILKQLLDIESHNTLMRR